MKYGSFTCFSLRMVSTCSRRFSPLWDSGTVLTTTDGRNMNHLQFLPKFLHLFHTQHLLPACLDAGYPTESVMTSLAMWIAWLYSHDPQYRAEMRQCDAYHGRRDSGSISGSEDGVEKSVPGPGSGSHTDSSSTSRSDRAPFETLHHCHGHSIEDRAEQQYMLRAYVFAAHRFSMYFAPWSAVQVPLPPMVPRVTTVTTVQGTSDLPEGGDADVNANVNMDPSEQGPTEQGMTTAQADQGDALGNGDDEGGSGVNGQGAGDAAANAANDVDFMADLRPVDRGVEVEWYGTRLRLSPPILAHAAILRFFDTRGEEDDDMEEDEKGEDDEQDDTPDTHVSNLGNPTLGTRRPHSLLSSLSHDRDFARLITCSNPRSTLGLPRSAWRGAFAGAWEGNFSFFEFEAYSNMLAGQTREVYTGPFGAQRQVWKLTETFVRRKWTLQEREERRGRREERRRKAMRKRGVIGRMVGEGDVDMDMDMDVDPVSTDGRDVQGGIDVNGNIILPATCSSSATATPTPVPTPTARASHPFPLRGPSTNAGFPIQPSTVTNGLASARAEELALEATIRQQVEAMEGYEIVPDEELEQTLLEDEEDAEWEWEGEGEGWWDEDEGEGENARGVGMEGTRGAGGGGGGVELLLTGTGHSAWGKFLLKGRVRCWDGMASLVKEYAVSFVGSARISCTAFMKGLGETRFLATHTAVDVVGFPRDKMVNQNCPVLVSHNLHTLFMPTFQSPSLLWLSSAICHIHNLHAIFS